MKKIIYTMLFCSLALGVRAQRLTLAECLDMARQHNRTLQNAALDIEAAKLQKDEAFTKYFPQISANVMAFYMFDKMIKQDGTYPEEIAYINPDLAALVGTPYSIHEFNSMYSASVSAIQPIYAGGQIHTGNKLADLQKDVAILQRDLKEKDVVQKVTEHFWQIAKLKYNLRTLDAADKYLTSFMETTERYIKAGLKTHNDELKVKLRQQELKSNRLKLENAQHVLLLLLAQEIGCPQTSEGGGFDILLPDEQTAAESMPAVVDAQTAVSNRTEYQLALKNVEAQQLQVKMERAKLMPTVAVGLMGYHTGLGGLSDNAKQFMNTHMNNGLVLGTISIPISDWWGGSKAIKRQKVKVQQAKNDADDAREKLIVDIESAWSNVEEAYEQIKVKQASAEQAEENLRLSTNQYKAGTEAITDLLDAETIDRSTQDALSSAIADYQVRLADYKRKVE